MIAHIALTFGVKLFIVVLKEARKYRVIGLKVTGTLMLNFINPQLAAFSLELAMHDKSSCYG